MSIVKYIVLGSYRSGTSNINESLGFHPQLKVACEIFHSSSTDFVTRINNFSEVLQRLYGIKNFENRKHILKCRFYPPDEDWIGIPHWQIIENVDLTKLIDYVFERYNGFKIMYQQLDRSSLTWDYLLDMKDLKIIHIIRKNYLESLVSYFLAFNSSKWNIQKGETVEDVPIHISVKSCKLYFEYMDFEIEHFTSLFRDALLINYENIFDWDVTTERIQDYLGIDKITLPSKYIKRSKKPLFEYIVNFEELSKYFQDTKWSHFFGKYRCLMI